MRARRSLKTADFHAKDFRDRSVAAPLKLSSRMHTSLRAPAFPRPIGRGPIEATALPWVLHGCADAFPRPIGRGPIEAYHLAAGEAGTEPHFRDRSVAAPLKHTTAWRLGGGWGQFPRPIGRGPIEASHSLANPRTSTTDFRDRSVAAPLKLLVARPVEGSAEGNFRDRSVAAPLKHSPSRRVRRGRR